MKINKMIRISDGYKIVLENGEQDRFPNPIGNDPFTNIISAGVKGYGSRLLASIDSGFSSRLLTSAEDDFTAYIKARKAPPVKVAAESSWQSQSRWKDEMGYGAFAGVQMYLAITIHLMLSSVANENVDTPKLELFRGSIPGLHVPLSTLHYCPCGK